MADGIQDDRKVPFAMVEVEVLRNSGIKPHLKALYGLLISYGPSRIFPGQQRLADEMGVTRPCMNGWLKALRATGLINWENREGTSNLYIILGAEGCNRTVTGGVTEGLQGDVTEGLHDLDPHDLDLPSDRRAKARTAPKPAEYDRIVLECDTEEVQCPNCDEPMRIADIQRNHGLCVTEDCYTAFEIDWTSGTSRIHAPKRYGNNRNNIIVNWLPAVRAFCELTSIPYGKVDGGTRGKWARKLQDLAGDMTPNEFAAIIPRLRDLVYQIEELDNPYMDRFAKALLDYRMTGGGSDLETVPLPELRARLAGGELRMDDLGAGEQAVVLARLGALP